MKGITVETVYDYSVGPGPRVKLTIDCNEFNPEHGWGNEYESCPELDELLQSHIDTVKAMNACNVSVVLENYEFSKESNEDDAFDEFVNNDLYWLFYYLEKFNVQSIWTYTTHDFVDLLNGRDDFTWVLTSHDRNAKKYFVCGIPDESAAFIEIPGQVIDKFPVKPLYRQAYNQRIWEINNNIYRDITNSVDPYYKIWFKNTVINN